MEWIKSYIHQPEEDRRRTKHVWNPPQRPTYTQLAATMVAVHSIHIEKDESRTTEPKRKQTQTKKADKTQTKPTATQTKEKQKDEEGEDFLTWMVQHQGVKARESQSKRKWNAPKATTKTPTNNKHITKLAQARKDKEPRQVRLTEQKERLEKRAEYAKTGMPLLRLHKAMLRRKNFAFATKEEQKITREVKILSHTYARRLEWRIQERRNRKLADQKPNQQP